MMTKDEQLIRDAGREIGAKMMEEAITSANSAEQVDNNMVALQWSCVHILATIAMNDVLLGGRNETQAIHHYMGMLHEEFRELIKFKAEL
jgi:hypothetical protein